MDLVTFENALKTELNDSLSGNKPFVTTFPDDFGNYIGQLKSRNGAILIAFQGSNWEAPEGNAESQLAQQGVYNWQFTVITKSLQRDDQQQGAYLILEEIRTILSGFTPTGFDDSSVLFPVAQGFLSESHGFFVYQITMAHSIEEAEA